MGFEVEVCVLGVVSSPFYSEPNSGLVGGWCIRVVLFVCVVLCLR